METQKTLEKYYYMTGDEKSKVGNADPIDSSVSFDFFDKKDNGFELEKPLTFRINEGEFSGTIGDYQFNSCGFLLFSSRLRTIFEKHLTNIDSPKWYPAQVIDLDNKVHNYSILHFFKRQNLLDLQNSIFVPNTDLPIKTRYDLNKIGERLIYSSAESVSLCVHDIVRKEIKKAECEGVYFYKIHTAGRLV
jgi:hypothetical protein